MRLFEKRYNLTKSGSKNLVVSIFLQTLFNLFLMTPVIVGFVFLRSQFGVFDGGKMFNLSPLYYASATLVIIDLLYITYYILYDKLYTNIYKETANARINLAEKLRQLPIGYFENKDLSDLSKTIMTDIQVLEQLFSHMVPQIYATIISSTILSILLLILNPVLAPILLMFVPIGFLIFFICQKKSQKTLKKTYIQQRKVSDKMQETFENIKEIKAFNYEEKTITEINNLLDVQHNIMKKEEMAIGIIQYSANALFELGLPIAAIVGSMFYKRGMIDLFTFISTLIIGLTITIPFVNILTEYNAIIFMKIRINRMKEIMNQKTLEGSKTENFKNFDITFDNVSFSYKKTNQTLTDVSFCAKQNEVTALIGPSGCGKTTITKLIARFYEIDKGCIKIGDIDIKSINPEHLLKHISIVFQDVVLFDLSVLENIRIGNPKATDEEVLQAAKIAQCDEFVIKLKDGYNTQIGENGHRLSGGERQRISIARAILKNAPIILLDESSASLDAENETKIQNAISSLIKNKTVIIIAHRLRTIKDANKIIVLDKGKIENIGTAKILEKYDGYYKRVTEKNN